MAAPCGLFPRHPKRGRNPKFKSPVGELLQPECAVTYVALNVVVYWVRPGAGCCCHNRVGPVAAAGVIIIANWQTGDTTRGGRVAGGY